MTKQKWYRRVKFRSRLVRKMISVCDAFSSDKGKPTYLSTGISDERWTFDNVEEFLASYSGDDVNFAQLGFRWDSPRLRFNLLFQHGETSISVESSRTSIDTVFSLFEEAPTEDQISVAKTTDSEITIFIGHGRNEQWIKLKSHLQDKHNLNILCYETGARAGHTIRDILDSMSNESSLAFLVLTGEDKTEDGIRARQNVIHECGLFQGRLGFDRAILLVEHGVELASNFDGIQQLRFKRGRISESFGDVIATIRREFGPI
jgi:predicted nucleotide-binding protein